MTMVDVVITSIDKIKPGSLTGVAVREIQDLRNTLEATRRAGKGQGYYLLRDDLRDCLPIINEVSLVTDKELAVQYKHLYILALASCRN